MTSINESAQRLRSTVDELKQAISGKQFSRMRPFDIAALLKRVARETLCPDDIHIELEVPQQPLVIEGIEALMAKALELVVRNTIEAMPRGGRLSLATELTANEVVVRVRDTEIGMSPQVLSRCLQSFYTTKANGSGMGLPVANTVTKWHRGRLELTSEYGHGTTVEFHLPNTEMPRKPE